MVNNYVHNAANITAGGLLIDRCAPNSSHILCESAEEVCDSL